MRIILAFITLSLHLSLHALPYDVLWTVCTTEVYPTGTGHIDIDNYFSVFNRRGDGSSLPADVGFEVGFLTWHEIRFEGGVDYLGGTDDPLFFNLGAALPEKKLFKNAPSFKVGIFNVGTRHRENRTDQNIVDFIVGKELPKCFGGTFCFGAFAGNRSMGKNRAGVMVSYTRNFKPAKFHDKDYFKWELCADYASGKNTIGGGGVGVAYYFTPDIYLETGPVWFNTAKFNGKWKWTVQVDISVPLFDAKKATF